MPDLVSCNPLGCDNCWCEDSADECCQISEFTISWWYVHTETVFSHLVLLYSFIVTKDCEGACGSGRCTRTSGNSILCCDDDCAAGCTGGTANDCNVCYC